MAKKWASKKGFTIIELLVTMVVIGILASITIVSYSGIQQRSRDSDRESDITLIKVALEKYHADKSMYPGVCTADDVPCVVSSLDTELKPYLVKIPHDPKQPVDSALDYQYIRGTTQSDGYGIRVSFESKAQCKTGANVNTTWWTGTPDC